MTVPYNCALNIEHYLDSSFRRDVRDIFMHHLDGSDDYPTGREIAKQWEITQAIRGLRDFGALRPDAEILGVAAGYEHTVFYLTNLVKRVFSTDLYFTNEIWKEANGLMLHNPAALIDYSLSWNPRRLVVQHMNALNLLYEDCTFDGVFSSGSIEHFGGVEDISCSIREMARVLRPNGVLVLSTEFRIHGNPDEIGVPGAVIFTPDMIMENIVYPSGLSLVDEPVFTVSDATKKEIYPLQEAIDFGTRARSIAVSHNDFAWTSVALCLQKKT